MSNILYHSAYGGTLVFEPNDSLEHAVTKEKIAERYNSNRNPGNYGSKNTGKEREIQNARDEAAGLAEKLCNQLVNIIKTRGSLDYCNKIINKKDDLTLLLGAKGVSDGFYEIHF